MKPKIDIILPEGNYLSMIEPFKSRGIPNKSIIHKKIPGCGITNYLIKYAKRHGIGILPNVPVIKSKVEEHNKEHPNQEILGVHKGIDVDDIKEYLLKDVEYKIILTTPEGFIEKVLPAFKGKLEQLYNDFFLLFDECERIITDISYRGAIAAPLSEFFNFKNKALVSATTLPFSSELFKDFDHYIIKPDYDYSKQLTVIHTNNVVSALEKVASELNSEHLFIFLNSTNGIHAAIMGLGIEKQSAVFCAQDSVLKLLVRKVKNASSEFSKDKLMKYNFFTSRYFSAIDMKFDFNADVVMISDIVFAEHSMLDPHTEIIQIAGRFRNGVKSLTHISNFNAEIEQVSQAETLSYFEGCLDLHDEIIRLLTRDKKKSSVDMLAFLEQKSPVADFYVKGKRNPFMLDNALNEVRVRGYYKDLSYLQKAYEEVDKHFKVNYKSDLYLVDDAEILQLNSTSTQKEIWREAASILAKLIPRSGRFMLLPTNLQELRDKLSHMFPILPDAVRLLGLDGLEQTNYVKSAITKAVSRAKRKLEDEGIKPYVYNVFAANSVEVETTLIEKLAKIAKEHRYLYNVSASLIQRFFHARRSTELTVNVWRIGNKLE